MTFVIIDTDNLIFRHNLNVCGCYEITFPHLIQLVNWQLVKITNILVKKHLKLSTVTELLKKSSFALFLNQMTIQYDNINRNVKIHRQCVADLVSTLLRLKNDGCSPLNVITLLTM